MSTPTHQLACLRANLPAFGKVDVDLAANVIRNACVMSIGPAEGHGFEIDAVSLQGLVDAMAANGGTMKIRTIHPKQDPETGQFEDDLFMDVGSLSNVRIDGNSVRGDVTLEDYAAVVPGQGDVRAYLMKRANKYPERFGLSPVIEFEVEPVNEGGVIRLMARITDVQSVDLVGRGATTPNGLLSAKTEPTKTVAATPQPKQSTKGLNQMDYDPKMNSQLAAMGFDGGDDEEKAKAFFNALDDDQKASLSVEDAPAEEVKPQPAAMSAKRTQIITDDGDRLLAREGKRVTQLNMLGQTLKVPGEVVQLSIAAGDTVIDAQKKFLAHLQANAKPAKVDGNVTVGEDRKIAALRAAIPEAIQMRSGRTLKKEHDLSRGLAQLSMLDMFRRYLVALGVGHEQAYGYGRTRLAELLGPRRFRQEFPQFAMLAQSTSDFDSILENTMRKSLRDEYIEHTRSWNKWAQRATTPDFKPVTRPQLSQASDLTPRNEGGEIKYATITDSKETYTLVEHVGGIKLTRQAMINDDLSAFNRIPRIQGQAAARLEDQLAYNVLSRNAALVDTVALFHATHANLVSGTGKVGLPYTVTVLDETNKLLRKQTGLGGKGKLNLSAKYMLVPTALEIGAQQFISSTVDPSKNNSTPNPFAGKMEVIASPFLDSGNTIPGSTSTTGSDTAWYIVADGIETVEVCFLSDEPEPVLRQETDFDTEDAKFAVRHTVAAAAVESRGMVKNPGA